MITIFWDPGYTLFFVVWHEVPTNCPTWINDECRCMVEVE